MKNFLLKTWLTMLCLLVGVGTSWAETIEINTENSGVTGSYADKTFEVSNVTFGFTQWMKSTNIQAKKSTTNSFYNVDAIPGNIKKVTVVQTGTTRAITMYGGTSSKPTTQITSPATGSKMEFDFSGKNYTYFSMTTPGNAVYINTITIEYETSAGSTPTNYTVTVANNIANGTVTASSTTAAEGDEITLTATPNDGYEFGSWNVTDASSNAITVTNNKFTMPAANVNVSATFTETQPVAALTTMDEIFAAATTAGATATDTKVTMNNWVISGVKNNNAYVTDGTKGFIIYTKDHGFVVGDILSGTVDCQVQLYRASAELTALTTSTPGLTVTKGGVINPVTTITLSSLSGINTGAVLSYENLQYNGTAFTDGETTITPYNTFITLPTLVNGKKYNVTGVYIQFNDTKEIAPRTSEDIEEVQSVTYRINISGNIENGTVKASVESAAQGATVNLTATPATGYEFGSWNVTNASTKEAIAVSNDQFTMPASDVTVSATFTEVQQGGGDEPTGSLVYKKVTSQADIEEGGVYLIVCEGRNHAMGSQNTSRRNAAAVTISKSTITLNSVNVEGSPYEVTLGKNGDLYTMVLSNGYYLGNGSGANNSNYLKEVKNLNSGYSWTLEFSQFNLTSKVYMKTNHETPRYLQVNSGNNDPYGSYQAKDNYEQVTFYKKEIVTSPLASIALSGEYKTKFIQNQEFSHAGVVVTANYEDESTKDVTAKATFSAPDMTTVGTKTITVSYTEGEVTKTETYEINVAAEELTSISLGGNYTTNFEQNADFNHDGLTVTAHYNSGRTADVTAEANVSTPDMTILGEQTITVSYGDQEITYTIKVAGYYTVTIDNTHDTNGTISVWNGDVELESGAQVLDGTVLTIECAPADGYKYKNWQYKDKGDWTTKYTNYEYSVNGYNVSFRANFEEIPLYTITYYVNGVPTTEEVREGAALNFPENPTLAGKVFRGWITEPKITEDTKYNEATGEPEYVSTIGSVTGDCTYFAVFATATIKEGSTGTDVWEKVPHDFTGWTEAANKDNQYLIVSEDTRVAGKGYAFVGNGDKGSYREVTIVDGKINDDTVNPFVYITMRTINTTHIGFVIHGSSNDGKLMGNQGENGLYTYDFTDQDQLDGITRAYANHEIAVNSFNNVGDKFSGQWSVRGYKSQGYTYLRYNTSEPFFRYYKTETTGNPVEFYVKKAATETTTTYSDFTTNMDVIERDKLTDKQYFTICYPFAVHPKAYAGAKAYNVVGKTMSGDRIATLELEEVAENAYLTAGMPYFMVGDATCFLGYHSLDNPATKAGNHNGLYGVFSDFAFRNENSGWAANEYYVITSNKVQAGTEISGVKANRAFIKKSDVPDYVAPDGESAARFVIELEEGTLTELDEVELKPIETSIYNLQGQRINRADKGVYIVNGRKVIR